MFLDIIQPVYFSKYVSETRFCLRLQVKHTQLDNVQKYNICTNAPSKQTKTNSVVLVRKRSIPTEQPPLVGKVCANFSG
jgi:hypothetical protein